MPSGPRKLLRAVLVSVATALTAAGLLGVPAPTATAAEPAAPSIPQRYLDQEIFWGDACAFDTIVRGVVPTANVSTCTFVNVPMDWRHPDAHPDITLAIAYTPASGKSKGLLVSNPGGPGGGEALSWSALLGTHKKRLLSDFDLLGFDPRGFGMSQPITCTTTQSRLDALPEVVDYRERTGATHAAEIAKAKLFADACSSSEFSPFVNTQQTVYDLDFLRALLNHRAPAAHPAYTKINYVGYSYGTWLGTWYADTYPARVGRSVLDSNMNWTGTMYQNQRSQAFSFERRRDAMFYPWLARHSATYKYGKTTRSVKAHYERTRAQLVALAKKGSPVPSVLEVDVAFAQAIYFDAKFDGIARYLGQLDEIVTSATPSDMRGLTASLRSQLHAQGLDTAYGAPLTLQKRPALRSSAAQAVDPEVDLPGDFGTIVRCNDSGFPRAVGPLLKRTDLDAKKYPFIGYTGTVNMCSYWPHKPVTRTIDLKGAPRMLMVQSEGDPATPYEGALAAHRKLAAKTRLISVDNDGQHGVYIVGAASCAQRLTDGYLFAGRMPSRDQSCARTSPLPLDRKLYAFQGPLNGKRVALGAVSSPSSTGAMYPLLARSWRLAQSAGWR